MYVFAANWPLTLLKSNIHRKFLEQTDHAEYDALLVGNEFLNFAELLFLNMQSINRKRLLNWLQLIATACSIVRYDNLDDLKRISRFESEVEPGVNSKANSKLLNSD